MRKKFYGVYQNLHELYRLSQYEFEYRRVPQLFPQLFDIRNLQTVEDAINQTLADLGLNGRLRPDARLFLFVNLHQMIVLPLAYAKASWLQERPVDSLIKDDLKTILDAAASESQADEISGHAILAALVKVWPKLRTSELNVWG